MAIIACDLDEVLSEYVECFCRFHNERHATAFSEKDFFSYRFEDVLNCSYEDALAAVRNFEASPHLLEIRPVVGAAARVAELAGDHVLTIVTSRRESIRDRTKAWIDRHYGNSFSDIRFADYYGDSGRAAKGKSDICREIGAELLIDDNLEYATECAEAGIPVLLYERPWNKNAKLPKNVTRVKSWDEIARRLS